MENRKILAVDDDPEIREVLRLLLTGEGYQVVEAENGDAACHQLLLRRTVEGESQSTVSMCTSGSDFLFSAVDAVHAVRRKICCTVVRCTGE